MKRSYRVCLLVGLLIVLTTVSMITLLQQPSQAPARFTYLYHWIDNEFVEIPVRVRNDYYSDGCWILASRERNGVVVYFLLHENGLWLLAEEPVPQYVLNGFTNKK
jgi:hypothetical protein